jgi:hypothetical protein
VAVHPTLRRCVGGYSDGVVRSFDVQRMAVVGKAHAQSEPVTAIAYIDEGTSLSSLCSHSHITFSRCLCGRITGRSVVCGTLDGHVLFFECADTTTAAADGSSSGGEGLHYTHSLPAPEHRDARIDAIAMSPHNPNQWLITDSMGYLCFAASTSTVAFHARSIRISDPFLGRVKQSAVALGVRMVWRRQRRSSLRRTQCAACGGPHRSVLCALPTGAVGRVQLRAGVRAADSGAVCTGASVAPHLHRSSVALVAAGGVR